MGKNAGYVLPGAYLKPVEDVGAFFTADGFMLNRLIKKILSSIVASRKERERAPETGLQQNDRQQTTLTPAQEKLQAQAKEQEQNGNLASAENLFYQLLSESPMVISAYLGYGNVLIRQEKYRPAREILGKALLLDPNCSALYASMALVDWGQKRYADAELNLRQAVSLDLNTSEYWVYLGDLYKELGRLNESIEAYGKVTENQSSYRAAEFGRGMAYWKRRDLNLAAQTLSSLTKKFPDFLPPFSALAQLNCIELDKYEEALKLIEHAIAAGCQQASDYATRGMAHHYLGNTYKAIKDTEKALQLDPENAQYRGNLANFYLLEGNYETGWQYYGIRLTSTQSFLTWFRGLAIYSIKDSLSGRGAVVYGEQGIGDQIMFASCIKDLLADKPSKIVLVCDEKLVALFGRSFPSCIVVSDQIDPSKISSLIQGLDFQIPIASLGAKYRGMLSRFENQSAYIAVDESLSEKWRMRLQQTGQKFNIGLSWKGGLAGTRRRHRTIPLEMLSELFALKQCNFYNLQYDGDPNEIEELSQFSNFIHSSEALDNYEDTAALVSELDLVVSVPTSIIHLGGALGKRVLVMSPKIPEWRYGLSQEKMVWYPENYVFRQERDGQWGSVIQRVVREIKIMVSAASK